MDENRLTILLQTQGAYPFVKGGGVSTWAEMMCNHLQDRVDFDIYCLVGSPYMRIQYDLPANITSITKIPMWGSELPIAYYEPDRSFSSIASEQEFTSTTAVKEIFLPLFENFLECLADPYACDAGKIGELLYRLWKYFNNYSYKHTLRNGLVWQLYNEKIKHNYLEHELDKKIDSINLLNATFGLRWFYHYLMPLDIDIPRVDVTHSSSAGFPAIASIIGKFEYGIPYVISDHGIYIRERLKGINEHNEMGFHSKKLLVNMSILIGRAAYYYADLICPVASSHKVWETEFGAEEQKIQPIINGVDVEKFKPVDEYRNKSPKRPTVVALANLFPLKDIETMIKTCHRVRRQIPEVQFLLYGDTSVDEPYTQQCRDLVEQLGLEDHFFIKGFHDNPTEVYNMGDISILTSVSEGAPYTVLESMSCGCPMVATDVGGVRDVLERCGIMCRPGAVKELADGVIKLLEDDLFREALGRKSRKIVLNNFTAEKSVNAYYDQYLKLSSKSSLPLKFDINQNFRTNGVTV